MELEIEGERIGSDSFTGVTKGQRQRSSPWQWPKRHWNARMGRKLRRKPNIISTWKKSKNIMNCGSNCRRTNFLNQSRNDYDQSRTDYESAKLQRDSQIREIKKKDKGHGKKR